MRRIETTRFILRDFCEEDLEDLYAYAKVDGIGEAAGWNHHKNIEETKRVLQHFLNVGDVYAIVWKENNKVIGSLGVHQCIDKEAREIGYVLSKDYWGMGIMTEAVAVVIRDLFNNTGLKRLSCEYFLGNIRSKRVMEKNNFHFKKAYKRNINGQDREIMQYVLEREELYDKNS